MPETTRRGFGKLLGGLLTGSAVPSRDKNIRPSHTNLDENNEGYRIVSIDSGFEHLDSPYDIEVKVEYGDPSGEVEYSRFLFEKEDLEAIDIDVASDILEYVGSKDDSISEQHYKLGKKVFRENFDGDIAEHYFANKIGETLEIEKSLGITSIQEFDEAIQQLNRHAGIEYENGEFVKNKYSQDIDEWMRTGW